jgi:hypothetical protein
MSDNYIVYCGMDNGLTFVNRESGNPVYIDLGNKDKNLKAVHMLEVHRLEDKNYAKIYPKENIFIHYTAFQEELEVWNLSTGQQIYTGKHKLLNIFQNKILIHDESTNRDIFYDLNFQEKFAQEKGCMAMSIDERYQIVNVPYQNDNCTFIELEKIQIYDTTSNTKIALELPRGMSALPCERAIRGDSNYIISAIWEDFLAICGELAEGDGYVFFFDIRNGKHLGSVCVTRADDNNRITHFIHLRWLNGCLIVEYGKDKASFVLLSFQEKNPFPPSPTIEKK